MKKFWILWHPQGNTPPTVSFTTEEAARSTAEKMIERIGKGTMFVMEAKAGVEVISKKKWKTAE